ncbi:Beta-barrel assembly machine subunit BamB [Marinospirillum celere]|uniref:Outer membrane protein assembly factor BamB n=1 Tax=Marinospirillum celere TaxID=1122252 RepID=A0A1I1J076_9GAMM|nr:outer membrane protein assembly factor BamB [Marinospirillum celere]SFC41531.1 Beta-barrel assembly machine subunit BamB [Marinospirillum celere]
MLASLSASLLKTAAVSLALFLVGCSSLPEPQYPPEPLPEHSGENSLQREWRDHSGFGERWRGYDLSPALSGSLLITGDAKGYLQAFDLEGGFLSSSRTLWTKELGVGISAGLTLVNDQLFLVTQNGQLVKKDARTGQEIWQVRLPSEALSPAQVGEGLVAVKTADGKLTGFNRETGRQLWSFDSRLPSLTLRGTASPTITSTQTFVGFANGRLYAVDNATGQARWDTRIAQPQGRTDIERLVDIDGQARLADGLLIINSYQGETQALDPFSGRSRWSQDISSFHSPVIHDGQVFIVDEASRIHALDLASGSNLWKQEALFGRQLTEPVILSGLLVVADYQGYIHLIDPETGRVTGRQGFDLDGIRSTPIVNEDRLLVHSIRGRLGLFTLKKD